MTSASVDHLPAQSRLRRLHALPALISCIVVRIPRVPRKKLLLTILSALLLCASVGAYYWQTSLLAGRTAAQNCNWYTVESGDTLSNIAWHYHSTTSILARANAIRNPNLIFVGQRLCIPHGQANAARGGGGVTPSGAVRWYAYNALEWSNRPQVRQLLYQTAAAHHLPARLLLAIAWQESGWTQHVIAWDGGIGVMQLMPYTAMSINAGLGRQLDPYDLQDNLELGATYLQWLWQDFHGDLPKIISAYNEGGWAVRHYGIYNWRYVNNVLALMRTLN